MKELSNHTKHPVGCKAEMVKASSRLLITCAALAHNIAAVPSRMETTNDGYLSLAVEKAIRKDSGAKLSDRLIASDPSRHQVVISLG